ncbi:MAG: hypothetical protein ABII00_09195 [Elusimicrobiota bacterium]
MKNDPSLARLMGSGLAHVQHAVDSAFFWGFRKLRSAGRGKESRKAAKRHPALSKAKKAGKGVLAFIGELGDSYYEKYGRLKSRK